MTKRIYILIAIICSLLLTDHSFAQLVDKTAAAIHNAPTIFNTDPTEDHLERGTNRDP